MQEAHAHAGGTCTCRDRGGAVSLGPGSMEILLDGMRLSENPCQHNHDLSYYFGSAGFVFVYIFYWRN